MCYDCKKNKADHSLLGYYEACRPCYDEHIKTMLEFKKERKMFPEINEIEPELYIGNEDAAVTESLIKKHNIASVLACGSHLETPFQKELKYKIFEIMDDPRQQILHLLEEGIHFIQEERKQGKAVLIHCAAGRSRSGSFAVAYIMKTRGMPYEDSLKFVQKKRFEVQPNRGFAAQLRLYGKQIGFPSIQLME